jgi:hypothetical protein
MFPRFAIAFRIPESAIAVLVLGDRRCRRIDLVDSQCAHGLVRGDADQSRQGGG